MYGIAHAKGDVKCNGTGRVHVIKHEEAVMGLSQAERVMEVVEDVEEPAEKHELTGRVQDNYVYTFLEGRVVRVGRKTGRLFICPFPLSSRLDRFHRRSSALNRGASNRSILRLVKGHDFGLEEFHVHRAHGDALGTGNDM